MLNDLFAAWMVALLETATGWELAAAMIGLAGIGFAGYGLIDNIVDRHYVKRESIKDDPRGITAFGLLLANLFMLLAWFGYTHVAMIAVYLPPRPDMPSSDLSEVAAMRLGFGFFCLLAQVVLRVMRGWLRNLKHEQWAPMFGDAEAWKAKYHEARAEVHQQRAEKHASLNRETSRELRMQMLERLLTKHGIEVPPVLKDRQP